VASDRTSLAETLSSSALLVNPWKVSNLANSLESILANPTTRTSLIERGLKNVQRFNWHSAGQTTMAILKKYGKNN